MKRYSKRLAKLEAKQQSELQSLVEAKLKSLIQIGDQENLTLDSEVILIEGDEHQYIAGLMHLAACGDARIRGEPESPPGPDVIIRSVREILSMDAQS